MNRINIGILLLLVGVLLFSFGVVFFQESWKEFRNLSLRKKGLFIISEISDPSSTWVVLMGLLCLIFGIFSIVSNFL